MVAVRVSWGHVDSLTYSVSVMDHGGRASSNARERVFKGLSLEDAKRISLREVRKGCAKLMPRVGREPHYHQRRLMAACLRAAAESRRAGWADGAKHWLSMAKRWRCSFHNEAREGLMWELENPLSLPPKDARPEIKLDNWGGRGGVFPASYRSTVIRCEW